MTLLTIMHELHLSLLIMRAHTYWSSLYEV